MRSRYAIHPLVTLLTLLALVSCSDDPTKPDDEFEEWPTVEWTMDWHPAWSADGRTVVYSHFSWDEQPFGIYMLHLDEDLEAEGLPELVAEVGNGLNWAENLDLSPDGSRVVFALSGQIWELNLTTKELREVTSDPGSARLPSWHPSGKSILYNRVFALGDDDSGIRSVDLATLENTPILQASGEGVFGGYARWSPDGESVVYLSSGEGGHGHEVYRVSPGKTNTVRLTDTEWAKRSPLWINGGQEIAFMRAFTTSTGRAHWYVMSPDGNNLRRLSVGGTNIDLGNHYIAMSPAGTAAMAPLGDEWNRLNMLWLVRWDRGQVERTQLTYPMCPVRLETFEGCSLTSVVSVLTLDTRRDRSGGSFRLRPEPVRARVSP